MKNDLPYHSIPISPLEVNAPNIIARMVDGLAFRYRWATEGLKQAELSFKPSEDSMDLEKLLHHVYDLCFRTDAKFGGVIEQNKSIQSLESLRASSLQHSSNLSQRLKAMTDSEFTKMMEGDDSQYSFWYTLNGPLADALSYVGQILSWRRILGNPQREGLNVFLGKPPKDL